MALSRIFGKNKKDAGLGATNHQQEHGRIDEVEKVPPPGEHKHGRDRLLYPLPPQKSYGKSQNHYAHPLQGVQFTLSQR